MGSDGFQNPVPIQVNSRKEEGTFEVEVIEEEGDFVRFED
jgi:hypothetical protein